MSAYLMRAVAVLAILMSVVVGTIAIVCGLLLLYGLLLALAATLSHSA